MFPIMYIRQRGVRVAFCHSILRNNVMKRTSGLRICAPLQEASTVAFAGARAPDPRLHLLNTHSIYKYTTVQRYEFVANGGI